MRDITDPAGRRPAHVWRLLGWGMVAVVLLLPWATGAPWTASDYLAAAALLGGTGLAFEALARRGGGRAFRGGAALALATVVLLAWVNAAVGLVGPEDHPYNLVFGAVLAVALLGALAARLRPAGLARAMQVTALVQLLAALGGLPFDPRGATFSLVFAGLWLGAAMLFRRAAQGTRPAGAGPDAR